jgi:centrosomal protein CEP76
VFVLLSLDIYDDIRSVLQSYLSDAQLDASKQAEVLSTLRSAGLFGDVLTGGLGPQVGFGYEASADAAAASAASSAPSFGATAGSGASASSSSTHLLPGGGRLVPGKRYLNVRIRGGRAFVDNLIDDAEARSGGLHVLRLSVELLGSRCVSAPVPATVEPAFSESFLFLLQNEESELEAMLPLEQLAELNAPLHLLVTRESSLGTTSLVSSVMVEWRKVLVHGRLSLNVELRGGDELAIPVGLLEMDLELLPLKMPPNPRELPVFVEYSALQKQLRHDSELSAAVEARFHAYAKAWWHDYNTIRPLHQTRLIQIFGLSEERKQRCVCTFLAPLRADRCLDSPLHAARFVRLIPFEKDARIGGQRTEIWHTPHSILAKRSGDLEDHALLLCSLLLGFGLDAYVCVGTTHDKGAHIWVMTRGGSGSGSGEPAGAAGAIVFWESLTGQRWELDTSPAARAKHAAGVGGAASHSNASSFPFASVHCVFNHRSFYANAQLDDSVHLVDWRLELPASWKAMNERAISVLPRRAPPIYLRGPLLHLPTEEKSLEGKLRELVANYRREYANLSTHWSADLSYLLAPALASYESERVTGVAYGQTEFQSAVTRSVPPNCVFKAVPFQFTSLNAAVLFASLLASRALVDLITASGADLRFGIRVKLVAYPEDFMAVWVMIASVKRADDFMTQPPPTLP